ncbi:unnamed protein product, partial [Prorocentrum cordatum]
MERFTLLCLRERRALHRAALHCASQARHALRLSQQVGTWATNSTDFGNVARANTGPKTCRQFSAAGASAAKAPAALENGLTMATALPRSFASCASRRRAGGEVKKRAKALFREFIESTANMFAPLMMREIPISWKASETREREGADEGARMGNIQHSLNPNPALGATLQGQGVGEPALTWARASSVLKMKEAITIGALGLDAARAKGPGPETGAPSRPFCAAGPQGTPQVLVVRLHAYLSKGSRPASLAAVGPPCRLQGATDPSTRPAIAQIAREIQPEEFSKVKQTCIGEISHGVAASIDKVLPQSISASTMPLPNDIEERMATRFNSTMARLVATDERVARLEAENQSLVERMERVEKVFDLPRVALRVPAARAADWDRPRGHSIFAINAREPIPVSALAEAIQPWLEARGYQLGRARRLEGPQMSKSFVLRFGIADGETHLAAETPVEIYVGLDKKQDVARERACKQLEISTAEALQKDVFVDRDAGALIMQWQPISKIEGIPATRLGFVGISRRWPTSAWSERGMLLSRAACSPESRKLTVVPLPSKGLPSAQVRAMRQHQVVADLRSVLARADPTWEEFQDVGNLPYLGASFARSVDRFLDLALPVLGYKYDPYRNARICLVRYEDGEKRYILHAIGFFVGQEVIASADAPIFVGNAMPLDNVPIGTQIHNISTDVYGQGALCRAAGTSATVLSRDDKYVTFKLPSTEVRMLPKTCWCTIGKVGRPEHNLIKLGKAGKSVHLGIRPHVRGRAKNAADHPQGGGEG